VSRARLAVACGATAALAAAVAIAVLVTAGDPEATAEARTPESLATVARGTLRAQVSQSGTLGYAAHPDGSAWSVLNQASGPYTRLPETGDTVDCGEALYRVDDQPVVLLCGGTPAYRTLRWGTEGPDVRVLNRNLVRLGYADADDLDPDSDEFGAATADALGDLQDHLGAERTEVLALGDAVVLPRALRITKVAAVEGTQARPGTALGEATSRRRSVTADLDPSQAAGVREGDRVQITLPDNRTATGVISHVGTVAASSGEEGSEATTIPVTIGLRKGSDVRGLDGAPVQIQITTETVRDALSVPVTALVAQAGGGYAVEVVDSSGRHTIVPVEVGLFDHAGGVVEVAGSGLREGRRVVVPGT
jgi:hypothetical protein